MDLDSYAIGAILDTHDPQRLKGIKGGLFDAEWQPVFDFIVSFVRKYRKLPRAETVSAKCGRTIEVGGEPLEYYVGELGNRAMRNAISNGLRKHVFSQIDKNDSAAAYKGLKTVVAEVSRMIRRDDSGGAISLRRDVKERTAHYRERKGKQGILGIETPWVSLTRVTSGWQDGDCIVFSARPEIGKTWLGLITAIHSVSQGYKVLFASQEMKPKKLFVRADAIGARISSDRFRRGVLTAAEERGLKTWYKRCMQDKKLGDLLMYGPSDIESIVDLELKILEERPNLVVWDSYYRVAETPDWKDMAQLTRDSKTLADRLDVPIILVTQLKRTIKKGDKKADTSDLAFTQAIEQDADIVLSMFRTMEMENLNEMLIRSIKIREGVRLRELMLRWDLDTMDFHEIQSIFTGGKGGEVFENREKVE